MNVALDPIVSEFSTQQEADAHDQWFRARVEAALRRADDPETPRFSTDEVMRRMDAVIHAAEAGHAQGSVA
ncbi:MULTISPECIES: stability determinant [Hydrogenophaga]|uniref:Stability determinant n=2 Tax=Hydrogenophaga TaxID=47420 RepID=A0ABW2QRP1_9BURK